MRWTGRAPLPRRLPRSVFRVFSPCQSLSSTRRIRCGKDAFTSSKAFHTGITPPDDSVARGNTVWTEDQQTIVMLAQRETAIVVDVDSFELRFKGNPVR